MREKLVLKVIGYSAGTAIVGSFLVVLIGMVFFGFQLAQWSEWEGVIVGMVGTIAGIGGAVVGLLLALRTERHI